MPLRKKEYNSGDLRIDRRAIATVSIPNEDNPSVMEIGVSLFVIPRKQFDMDVYQEQVDRITTYSSKLLKGYVRDNKDVFDDRFILDINFSTANLKKGYNKSVQMSMFVKKKCMRRTERMVSLIKDGMRPIVNAITKRMSEEGFSCHKRRLAINKKKK